MHLTTHTDYALRLLIYLQARPEAPASVREVAEAYGISAHHLAKVAQTLAGLGWIDSRRGRGGGLALGEGAPQLGLGEVVRALEPDALVECHGDRSACPIEPACKLKGVLYEAREAFYAALDDYTLADLARQPRKLTRLLVSVGPR
ncbi:MAG: Rrf2 family transcriptional regulator [Phycisphaerales bacterium JB063]